MMAKFSATGSDWHVTSIIVTPDNLPNSLAISFACLTQAGSSGEVPGPANLSSWMAANADVALPQAAKIMNAAKAEIRETVSWHA